MQAGGQERRQAGSPPGSPQPISQLLHAGLVRLTLRLPLAQRQQHALRVLNGAPLGARSAVQLRGVLSHSRGPRLHMRRRRRWCHCAAAARRARAALAAPGHTFGNRGSILHGTAEGAVLLIPGVQRACGEGQSARRARQRRVGRCPLSIRRRHGSHDCGLERVFPTAHHHVHTHTSHQKLPQNSPHTAPPRIAACSSSLPPLPAGPALK